MIRKDKVWPLKNNISFSISYRYVINFLIVYGPFLGAYSDEGPASLEGTLYSNLGIFWGNRLGSKF